MRQEIPKNDEIRIHVSEIWKLIYPKSYHFFVDDEKEYYEKILADLIEVFKAITAEFPHSLDELKLLKSMEITINSYVKEYKKEMTEKYHNIMKKDIPDQAEVKLELKKDSKVEHQLPKSLYDILRRNAIELWKFNDKRSHNYMREGWGFSQIYEDGIEKIIRLWLADREKFNFDLVENMISSSVDTCNEKRRELENIFFKNNFPNKRSKLYLEKHSEYLPKGKMQKQAFKQYTIPYVVKKKNEFELDSLCLSNFDKKAESHVGRKLTPYHFLTSAYTLSEAMAFAESYNRELYSEKFKGAIDMREVGATKVYYTEVFISQTEVIDKFVYVRLLDAGEYILNLLVEKKESENQSRTDENIHFMEAINKIDLTGYPKIIVDAVIAVGELALFLKRSYQLDIFAQAFLHKMTNIIQTASQDPELSRQLKILDQFKKDFAEEMQKKYSKEGLQPFPGILTTDSELKPVLKKETEVTLAATAPQQLPSTVGSTEQAPPSQLESPPTKKRKSSAEKTPSNKRILSVALRFTLTASASQSQQPQSGSTAKEELTPR